MGPIQSSINTTLGLIAGLKKLEGIEEKVESNADYTKTLVDKYGLTPENAKNQTQLFNTLANNNLVNSTYQQLSNFNQQKNESALQNLAKQQQTKVAQQQQAQAYKAAIKQKEENMEVKK